MASSPDANRITNENYDYAATILLVDDDETVRTLAQIVLDAAGYRILPAQDASDALKQAELYPGKIEALVTDVVLPGVSGRDLAESITATRPEIRVLFMSGYTDDIIGNYTMINKAARFLKKPYTPAMLISEVQQMLVCQNDA